MSDTIIKVENIGKKYIINHQKQERYTALRDVITKRASAVARKIVPGKTSSLSESTKEEFWALKDISFDIKQGEVVGIIGRNGAGKSTLLKILSRITEPTTGRITLKGRVASLLEVGTGFHPELTGRENIFLNGAVLGMSRVEIKRKFDEIVDFAEVEKFLDTPVKRYSSGMYVRLAFAVAAHLEPEILVVDEVLAVGDGEFQKKCLGKMNDVSKKEGRTVLFVSHNMAAISNLCPMSVLLNKGQLIYKGNTSTVIQKYLSSSNRINYSELGQFYQDYWVSSEQKVISSLAIKSVGLKLEGEQPSHSLVLDLVLKSYYEHNSAFIAVDILNSFGTVIMQSIPRFEGFINYLPTPQSMQICIKLPPLVPDQYFISVWVGSHNTETFDEIKECLTFEIQQSPTKNRNFPHTIDHGFIVPDSKVEFTSYESSEITRI